MATSYTVTDLDPGMFSAEAVAINNYRHVFGHTNGLFRGKDRKIRK